VDFTPWKVLLVTINDNNNSTNKWRSLHPKHCYVRKMCNLRYHYPKFRYHLHKKPHIKELDFQYKNEIHFFRFSSSATITIKVSVLHASKTNRRMIWNQYNYQTFFGFLIPSNDIDVVPIVAHKSQLSLESKFGLFLD
jgi:hypothetical protein